VLSVPYAEELSEEWTLLESAMRQIKESSMQYIIGVINPPTWRHVARVAQRHGVMGVDGFTWYLAELNEITGSSFALGREKDSDLARAIHGSSSLFWHVEPHESLNEQLSARPGHRGPR